MDCSGGSYVPNNPQFGLQFECNWTTPGGGNGGNFGVSGTSSPNSNCYPQNTYTSNNPPSPVPCSTNGQALCCGAQTDDLASCWNSEDMGSLTLPLELDPLPSLFPFSPCSASGNSGCNNTSPSNSPGDNNITYKLEPGSKQSPSDNMADVLLSLKHAVVHPNQFVGHHHHHHHHHHIPCNATGVEKYETSQQSPHLYHHHPINTTSGGSTHQLLLSPSGYASTGLCGDQVFSGQQTTTPLFPSMSVNVSMNMTMHGYHPTASVSAGYHPAGADVTTHCPQVQWNAGPSQVSMPGCQSQGLLSPNYGGATYSFTADFRPQQSQQQQSHQSLLQHDQLNGCSMASYKTVPLSFTSPDRRRGSLTVAVEEENSQKPNICRICGKSYARPSTLKTHLRTHSGEKPYRCIDCNKSFSQAANLTAHVRTHSGEKPFRCPVCDRRFSQSSSVTTHMRTHSGERPYRCRLCKKAFSDSSTLTKHLRIHSGEKPYECKLCLLRFSQSGNLNRHMRVHGTTVNASGTMSVGNGGVSLMMAP